MLYALLVVLTVVSDQLLKYWTVTNLELGESAPFIPPHYAADTAA